jgi:hypothetical protein
LKRKSKSTFAKAKTENGIDIHHKLQVGGYSRSVKKLNPFGDVKLDITMSCRETGEARVIPIADTERWEHAYYHQNRSWMLRKGWGNPAERLAADPDKVKAFMDECLEHQLWTIK